MPTISKCHIYHASKMSRSVYADISNIFLPIGDADKKIGLKIEKTWHYLFLIDKAKILDLLSLIFIEQNKIFYLMILLVL